MHGTIVEHLVNMLNGLNSIPCICASHNTHAHAHARARTHVCHTVDFLLDHDPLLVLTIFYTVKYKVYFILLNEKVENQILTDDT